MDTLIDYPKSREYAFEMFDSLGSLGILNDDQIKKYKLHVDQLMYQPEEDELSSHTDETWE